MSSFRLSLATWAVLQLCSRRSVADISALGDKCTLECPWPVAVHLPVARSHSLTVLSAEADNKSWLVPGLTLPTIAKAFTWSAQLLVLGFEQSTRRVFASLPTDICPITMICVLSGSVEWTEEAFAFNSSFSFHYRKGEAFSAFSEHSTR